MFRKIGIALGVAALLVAGIAAPAGASAGNPPPPPDFPCQMWPVPCVPRWR